MISIIATVTYKKRQKEMNGRPSISYNNPIYSYENGNVVEEDDINTQSSFYDDAVQPNNTQYYNDVDPNHNIQNAEEQKNRYKLGLEPLPPIVKKNTSEI